jgi:hypothetical protein
LRWTGGQARTCRLPARGSDLPPLNRQSI